MLNKEKHVLGYNRQEVDTFLQQLADEHQAERSALQSQIAAATTEMARLDQERQLLEAEQQRRFAERRLLCLATEQFELGRQALHHAMEEQAERERAALQDRMAKSEQLCRDLDDQISALQRQIDAMIRSCVAVVGAEREDGAETATQTAVDHQLAPATRSSPTPAEQQQSSFWDDELEAIISQDQGQSQVTPALGATVAAAAAAESETAGQTVPRAEPESKEPASPSVSISPAQVGPASPAVAAEVRNVRHRYIVGKVAGEDLRDDQDTLIVARGRTITAEIVAAAELSGRLPELIVNMQLPELGDR